MKISPKCGAASPAFGKKADFAVIISLRAADLERLPGSAAEKAARETQPGAIISRLKPLTI